MGTLRVPLGRGSNLNLNIGQTYLNRDVLDGLLSFVSWATAAI
jgi:hypothetical protein